MDMHRLKPAADNGWALRLLHIAFAICLVCLKATLTDGEPVVEVVSPVENEIIWDRNQTVKFNCTVTSGTSGGSFEWWRNLQKFDADFTNTPFWSSFTRQGLKTKDDEGVYTCTYGSASNEVTVYVASKPEIVVGEGKTSQSPVDARVDESSVLGCFANGWPQPKLKWFRNNKDVNSSAEESKYILEQEGHTLKLKIIGVQKEDEGGYICVAENALGAVSRSVSLIVKDPIEIRNPKMTAEHKAYSAELGTNVTLTCYGEETKRSSFTDVSWRFNGTQIFSSDRYDIVDAYSDQGKTKISPKVRTQLTISNFSHLDQGAYTCSVKTEVNTANDTIWLSVKSKDGRPGGLSRAVVIAMVVVSCVLIVGLGVLGFSMWQRRKRKRQLTKIAQKYDLEDQRFDKDVFVSYSSKDFGWVKQHLQPLLDRHGIQYIIHSRDFKPGKAFLDNMADSVYHSRRVILVVSANYMGSSYCKAEMKMAVHRCAEKQDASLVLIRIDNMKAKELPRSVRSRTFIDYTSSEEKGTWEERVVGFVKSDADTSLSGEDSQETTMENATDRTSFLSTLFKIKRKPEREKPKELNRNGHCLI